MWTVQTRQMHLVRTKTKRIWNFHIQISLYSPLLPLLKLKMAKLHCHSSAHQYWRHSSVRSYCAPIAASITFFDIETTRFIVRRQMTVSEIKMVKKHRRRMGFVHSFVSLIANRNRKYSAPKQNKRNSCARFESLGFGLCTHAPIMRKSFSIRYNFFFLFFSVTLVSFAFTKRQRDAPFWTNSHWLNETIECKKLCLIWHKRMRRARVHAHWTHWRKMNANRNEYCRVCASLVLCCRFFLLRTCEQFEKLEKQNNIVHHRELDSMPFGSVGQWGGKLYACDRSQCVTPFSLETLFHFMSSLVWCVRTHFGDTNHEPTRREKRTQIPNEIFAQIRSLFRTVGIDWWRRTHLNTTEYTKWFR